jgi:hypothetical protein
MSDQLKLDLLYHSIYVQKLRYDTFNAIQTSGVWNKSKDEKSILDQLIYEYKNYYLKKTDDLIKKLNDEKEYNITSYLTLSTEFYITKFNQEIEQIDTYLLKLKKIDHNNVLNTDLSIISADIDLKYFDFLLKPTIKYSN